MTPAAAPGATTSTADAATSPRPARTPPSGSPSCGRCSPRRGAGRRRTAASSRRPDVGRAAPPNASRYAASVSAYIARCFSPSAGPPLVGSWCSGRPSTSPQNRFQYDFGCTSGAGATPRPPLRTGRPGWPGGHGEEHEPLVLATTRSAKARDQPFSRASRAAKGRATSPRRRCRRPRSERAESCDPATDSPCREGIGSGHRVVRCGGGRMCARCEGRSFLPLPLRERGRG